jgi:hypothetical protein
MYLTGETHQHQDLHQLSLSAFSSKEPRKMRNIEDLYDVTQVMKDITLFYFFADSDLLSFNEVVT